MGDILLSVDAGAANDGTRLTFTSYQEIFDWANSEITFWKFLEQPARNIWRDIHNPLNDIRSFANTAHGLPQPEAENHLRQIRNIFTPLYRDHSLPTPGTARRVFIENLINYKLIHHAIGATEYWWNNQGAIPANHYTAGIIRAILFDMGLDNARDISGAFKIAFDETLTRVNNEQKSFIDDAHRKAESASELIAQIKHSQEEQVQIFRDTLKTIQGNFSTLERTYNEKMGLKAPTRYWKSEILGRTKGARYWAITFGLSIALGVGLLLYLYFEILSIEIKDPLKIENWIPLLFVAFPLVWCWRLIARMMLSNAHLATDAAERRVMTQTYLALLAQDKAIDPDDRRMLLANLFRPTSGGIVKDDASPPHWLELLINRVQKS